MSVGPGEPGQVPGHDHAGHDHADSGSVRGVRPHGIAVGADGLTIWFVGQDAATVGRINPDFRVEQFPLPTRAARPSYLVLGPDGNMWGTEGDGADNVFRVDPSGAARSLPSRRVSCRR